MSTIPGPPCGPASMVYTWSPVRANFCAGSGEEKANVASKSQAPRPFTAHLRRLRISSVDLESSGGIVQIHRIAAVENLLPFDPGFLYMGVHAERRAGEDDKIRILANLEAAYPALEVQHFRRINREALERRILAHPATHGERRRAQQQARSW